MNDKLENIKIENFFIFIYYILLTLYLYGNTIEENYIRYNNNIDREKYRIILIIVFGITFIIALYYAIENYNELKYNYNFKTRNLEELSFFANILVLIAAAIAIYISYNDKDLDLEVTL